MNVLSLLTKDEEKYVRYVSYEARETIFHEDDECRSIGIVVEGSVSIKTWSLLGNEIIFNTLKSGQAFGNNLIFSSSPFYKGDVVTLTKTQIAFIEKEDLLDLLKKNNGFLLYYLERQSDMSKALNSKIRLLSLGSARERLLYLLEDNDGSYRYTTITALAAELNLERETLSRTISSLVEERLIIRDGKTIKIRP
ncbi:MAG: Crp/Fnr family transcriptional regulator [Erysipelotrichaceae bacterium]|nr:Crp/Fnr family transcriptional regulator [Erysipelotrichaceae bacterium]